MARIRSIKPEFWTDEKVVELSAFARLLFIGLWNFADDEGRMVCSPKRIKMQIFPSDSVDCSALLGEIRGESLIELYVVDGQEYLQINGFTKHQKVDKRTPSKLPPPPDHPPESPRVVPTEGIKEGIKEVNPPLPPKGGCAGFDRFWAAYPKKVGKGAAEKAFSKAPINGRLADVLTALERQKHSEQWQRDGGQFIPHPATWLNQRRWEDEPPSPAEQAKPRLAL